MKVLTPDVKLYSKPVPVTSFGIVGASPFPRDGSIKGEVGLVDMG